jgi:hypothetical protein
VIAALAAIVIGAGAALARDVKVNYVPGKDFSGYPARASDHPEPPWNIHPGRARRGGTGVQTEMTEDAVDDGGLLDERHHAQAIATAGAGSARRRR